MSLIETLPDWNSLPGMTLEGGYELKEIIEAEGERALLRVRVLGDYSLRAAAAFFPLEAQAAHDQVGIWRSLRTFDHRANLDVPLGSGTVEVDGTTLAYIVLQVPDETLREVLAQRALEPEETTDVLRAVARGLGELHANGYVHGCVAPEQVLAVGDEIKLSVDSLRRPNAEPIVEPKPATYLAPESDARNLTIAADVWCLGAMVFEALMRRTYEPGLYEEAAALKHPFGMLTERCLEPDPDKRAKLSELEGILRSKAPLAKSKPVVMAPTSPEPLKSSAATAGASNGTAIHAVVTPVQEPPAPVRTEPPAPKLPLNGSALTNGAPHGSERKNGPLMTAAVEPKLRPQASRPVPQSRPAVKTWEAADEPDRGAAQRRAWVYAISAFVAIFFALWFLRYYSHSVANRSAKIIHQAPAVGNHPGPAWPTKTLSPDAKTAPPALPSQETRSTPVAAPAVATPAATAVAHGSARPIWRVVLYTYYRQEDATRKAQELNAKRPDLHAEAFSPGASGSPYLVVAGGAMNRQTAAQLRSRALREGMPHDSYIQNYSH